MTVSVQPTALYSPGAISSDTEIAAHLARGRALQSRALRESFGAAIRPLASLLKCYGCLRGRYTRPSGRPWATS